MELLDFMKGKQEPQTTSHLKVEDSFIYKVALLFFLRLFEAHGDICPFMKPGDFCLNEMFERTGLKC